MREKDWETEMGIKRGVGTKGELIVGETKGEGRRNRREIKWIERERERERETEREGKDADKGTEQQSDIRYFQLKYRY